MSAPGNAAAFAAALQAALRHHQSGALPQAEALYRQALALDPRNPDALHFLGIACSQQGRYEEAVRLFEQELASAAVAGARFISHGLSVTQHQSRSTSHSEREWRAMNSSVTRAV